MPVDSSRTNYLEQDIVGKQWQRLSKFILDISLAGSITLCFCQEKVVQFPGDTVTKDCGMLNSTYSPEAQVPVIDPDTDLPTGATTTQKEIYKMIYSLYCQRRMV